MRDNIFCAGYTLYGEPGTNCCRRERRASKSIQPLTDFHPPYLIHTTDRLEIEMRLAAPYLGAVSEKLFTMQGDTASGWIRIRRLDRCRRDPLDPGLRGESPSASIYLSSPQSRCANRQSIVRVQPMTAHYSRGDH
ncbi:hypothetical protein [Nocardia tenerifensis]|uniref:hypothetical protein n=1 Tax=Nocardia tenerifensis TaxID=228006 RepID=UPI0003102352|nr:hypothetical protein [Nocardia tenerifensis]